MPPTKESGIDLGDFRHAAQEVVDDEGNGPGDWHPRTVYLARAVLQLLRLLEESPE